MLAANSFTLANESNLQHYNIGWNVVDAAQQPNNAGACYCDKHPWSASESNPQHYTIDWDVVDASQQPKTQARAIAINIRGTRAKAIRTTILIGMVLVQHNNQTTQARAIAVDIVGRAREQFAAL